MATEYYVTMHRNDVDLSMPSNAFAKWKPSPLLGTGAAPAPVRSQTAPVRSQTAPAIKLQEQYPIADCGTPFGANPSTCGRTHIHLTMGGGTAASRSAPVGSAVASEAALRSIATAKLKRIEPDEPAQATINDGNHARRALADLNARRGPN